MQIALLTSFHQRELKRTNHYFLLRGWEQALLGHATVRLARYDEPTLEIKRTLAEFDLAILVGDADPTLVPHTEGELRRLGVRVIDPGIHEALAGFQPEWFLPTPALAHAIPKPVFFSDLRHPSLSQALYQELNRWQPTLLLADDRETLRAGFAPGLRTLYSPSFPEAPLSALASASFVVTLDKVTARAAATLQVPALFVTDCEADSEEMVTLGMETIVFTRGEPVTAVAKRARVKAARGLPMVTETVCQSQLAKQANRVHVVVPPVPTPFAAAEPAPLRVACIADWKYVPFFLGLATNLRSVHKGPIDFFVLAMDDKTDRFLRHSPLLGNGRIYRFADLWDERSLKWLSFRSLAYRAYTCKPKVLQKILDENGGQALYCDLDIFYYQSPAEWLANLGKHAVRVCPQRNDCIEYDRYYGFFQAGLIGVNERASAFLTWWGRLSFYKCLNTRRSHDYYMEDQGYLDLAPALFAEFGVDWSGQQNVAPWNLGSLSAFPDPETPWRPRLASGALANSLHVSHLDRFGFGLAKYAWDQISLFFSAYPESEAEALLPHAVSAQAKFFGPLCRVFDWNLSWFQRRPHRFLTVWHSPLRWIAEPIAILYFAYRTNREARDTRFWVHKQPRIRKRQLRRKTPPLNWSEMVGRLIARRQLIEKFSGGAILPTPSPTAREAPDLRIDEALPPEPYTLPPEIGA